MYQKEQLHTLLPKRVYSGSNAQHCATSLGKELLTPLPKGIVNNKKCFILYICFLEEKKKFLLCSCQ